MLMGCTAAGSTTPANQAVLYVGGPWICRWGLLWRDTLQRVRGKREFDGQERVSSQTLLDVIEVPQRQRTAGTFRRLARLMAESLDGCTGP